jgi:hypothetical protein
MPARRFGISWQQVHLLPLLLDRSGMTTTTPMSILRERRDLAWMSVFADADVAGVSVRLSTEILWLV